MPPLKQPGHFVVDGSNIATEGRSVPSLAQLNDAVMAFIETNPEVVITVVVDATFGHRIDKSEVADFDEAVANNELVTPPAGAIGRGDAFVLTIANKAKAGVLSNDSFQEFHGEYDWLFDEGRLVGGKPVPNVGWVFVNRSPVRGPKSRQSIRAASGDPQADKRRARDRVRVKKSDGDHDVDGGADSGSPATTPAAGSEAPRPARGRRGRSADAVQAPVERAATEPRAHVNDLMPFLDFVGSKPLGSPCVGVVDSYASHGAYAKVGDALVYIPLRLMGDPPPPSARKALQLGDSVDLIVTGFVPERRSIDAALAAAVATPAVVAALAGAAPPAAEPTKPARGRTGSRRSGTAEPATPNVATAAAGADLDAVPAAARSRRRGPKAQAAAEADVTRPAAVEPAAVEPAAVEPAVLEPAARAGRAKRSASKRVASASDVATTDASVPATATAAKRSTAKRSTTKAAAGEQAVAAKPDAEPAKRAAPAKKAPAAKKAPVPKRAAATVAPVKQAAAAKKQVAPATTSAPAKRAAAPTKRAPAKKAAPAKASTAAKKAPAARGGGRSTGTES